MNNNTYIPKLDISFMSLECLDHDNNMPDIDYLREIQEKYKPANSEELFEAAMEEMRISRGVYRFLEYKFKKN